MPCSVETTDPGSEQYEPGGIASEGNTASASLSGVTRASRTSVASGLSVPSGGGFASVLVHDATGTAATTMHTPTPTQTLETDKAMVISVLRELATEVPRREKRGTRRLGAQIGSRFLDDRPGGMRRAEATAARVSVSAATISPTSNGLRIHRMRSSSISSGRRAE